MSDVRTFASRPIPLVKRVVASVASLMLLAVIVAPSSDAAVSGFANDGYCSFNYSLSLNQFNQPVAIASEWQGCQWVDADVTQYWDANFVVRNQYCASDPSTAQCVASVPAGFVPIDGRVRGLDWEYGTWQTLYKTDWG